MDEAGKRMGVETKKMANSIAAAGENLGDRIKAWPERTKAFYNDVRTEMKKVTAPSHEGSARHDDGRHHHRVSLWRVLLGRR